MRVNHRRWVTGRLLLPMLLVASTAGAQVVDQEQAVMDFTSVGDMVLGGFYNQELAQVFTAGQTGFLAGAEFAVECVNYNEAPAGAITLEVRNVEADGPGATLLAAATFNPIYFTGYWPNDWPPYFRRLMLSTPTSVTVGIQYALTLRFTTANDTACGVVGGPEGDPYPGGDGRYRENGPGGWFPLGSRVDMPFRTLMDATAPTLTVPDDVFVDGVSPAGAVVTYSVSAVDDGDSNPTVVCSPPSGSVFPLLLTVVSCSATDAAGNTATRTFNVIVKDASWQLQDLTGLVNSWNLSTLGPSLSARLQATHRFIASGKLSQACDSLNSVLKQVDAQAGKGLSIEQAAELMDRATRLKNVCGC